MPSRGGAAQDTDPHHTPDPTRELAASISDRLVHSASPCPSFQLRIDQALFLAAISTFSVTFPISFLSP